MVGLSLDIPEPQGDEDPATEKQRQFIRALIREVGASGFPEETLNDLGKWQASSLIEQLQSFKRELAGELPLDSSRLNRKNIEQGKGILNIGAVLLFLVVALLVFVAIKGA